MMHVDFGGDRVPLSLSTGFHHVMDRLARDADLEAPDAELHHRPPPSWLRRWLAA